jgi:hypothetical protein
MASQHCTWVQLAVLQMMSSGLGLTVVEAGHAVAPVLYVLHLWFSVQQTAVVQPVVAHVIKEGLAFAVCVPAGHV